MKKTIYLFACVLIISGFSAISVAGQTALKRAKKPVVKKVDPQIVAAEKSWPEFINALKITFAGNDRLAIKKLLTPGVSCGWGADNQWVSAEGKDSRDACIDKWQTAEFLNGLDSHSIVAYLSQNPCKIVKSDWQPGQYGRNICPVYRGKRCNQGTCFIDGFSAGFVFSNGKWLLDDFGEHETE